MDFWRRVFHISTESDPFTFASGLHYAADLRIQTYTEPVPLKCEKLATKKSGGCRLFLTVYRPTCRR